MITLLFYYILHSLSLQGHATFFLQVWRCRNEACCQSYPSLQEQTRPKKLERSLSHSQNGALQKGIGTLYPSDIRCINGVDYSGAPHPKGFPTTFPKGKFHLQRYKEEFELNKLGWSGALVFVASPWNPQQVCPWRCIEIEIDGISLGTRLLLSGFLCSLDGVMVYLRKHFTGTYCSLQGGPLPISNWVTNP